MDDLNKILSLSDEELALFRDKNGLQNDEEWWRFVGNQQQLEEIQEEETPTSPGYQIRPYDPLQDDITNIIHYFLHSAIYQDSVGFEEDISMEERQGIIHKINCIIDEKNNIKVASQPESEDKQRIVGILWYNYSYPKKQSDDRTIVLEGMAVSPDYRRQGLGRELVWDMIRENNERISILKGDDVPRGSTIEKVVLYRPESLESTVRFYEKMGFLHCKGKDRRPVVEVNRNSSISKKMMLPLTKKMFLECIKDSAKIKPGEIKALRGLASEKLVLDYLQRASHREAHYNPDDIRRYNEKRSENSKLFSALNPFLRFLVARLPDETIRRESIFKPYLI
tara:strand:- start:11076 stop:12089 length:1014 start_codon:yes stop_codon:yes gene_type:complete